MSINTGGPAFPTTGRHNGMTLRDYFAAKAMQAIVSSEGAEKELPDDIATFAYQQADAMIQARNA